MIVDHPRQGDHSAATGIPIPVHWQERVAIVIFTDLEHHRRAFRNARDSDQLVWFPAAAFKDLLRKRKALIGCEPTLVTMTRTVNFGKRHRHLLQVGE